MLDQLDRAERLQLMRFVCSFAWADLEVQSEERRFVSRLIHKLDLDAGEKRQVEGWLRSPPDAESVDPTQIPLEHRKLFVEYVEELVDADDEISLEEMDSLTLFRELLS